MVRFRRILAGRSAPWRLMDESPLATVSPDQFRRIREVFESALECPQKERRSFIERACQGDTVLLREVEGMLAAEERSQAVLDFAPAAAAAARSAALAYENRFQAGALIAGR